MSDAREPMDPRISMWHFLAFFMRFWRVKAGMTLAQVGRAMGLAPSTVCNMEAGRRRPQDDHMRLLDKHYGTGLLFQLILWFARTAHDPDWGHQLVKYEEKAHRREGGFHRSLPRDHRAIPGELRMSVRWRKSSYSGGANDQHCVELGRLSSGVGMRDSKDPAGGHISLSVADFAAHVGQLKRHPER